MPKRSAVTRRAALPRRPLDLDAEAARLDHAMRRLGGEAGGGQVALDEDGVRRVKRERLPGGEIAFAAASGADLGGGIREAEEAEGLQAAARGKRFGAGARAVTEVTDDSGAVGDPGTPTVAVDVS